jgi:hypothetical protein
MKQDPTKVEALARKLARQRCYMDLDLEVTPENVETILTTIRQYEDENWTRFAEKAERMLSN